MNSVKSLILSLTVFSISLSNICFADNNTVNCPEVIDHPHYLFGGLFFDINNSLDDKTLNNCRTNKILAEDIGIAKYQRAEGHKRYDHFVHQFAKIGLGLRIYVDEGTEYPLPNSYWYFDNVNGSDNGDGTYEHPFKSINAKAYNLIVTNTKDQQNITIYLASNKTPYDLNNLTKDNKFILPKGYSLYGRISDFKVAAQGLERPEILGAIAPLGDNTLNDISIVSRNFGYATTGALQLINATNIYLNDINLIDSESKNDVYGIYALNSVASLNNSTINVNLTADKLAKTSLSQEGSHAVGVFIDKGSSILFTGNNNEVLVSSDGFNTRTGGIALESGKLTITGDNNLITANSTGNENKAVAIVGDFATTIISGNNNQITAKSAASNSIGVMSNSSELKITGNENLVIADTLGSNQTALESNAGGIIGIKSTTEIFGNFNRIIANAAGANGKALGIGNFPAGGLDNHNANIGETRISILGNYNQIKANSFENNAIGIGNTGTLTIAGTNNLVSSNATDANKNALGIFDFGGSNKAITGANNKIITTAGTR